jgi:hypothetical protein
MKFALSPKEKLGLVIHLFGQPANGPEHWRRRLRIWKELGAEDLADELADNGRALTPSQWVGTERSLEVELTPDTVDQILKAIERPKNKEASDGWTDVLARLYFRLEEAKKAGGQP